MYCGSVQSQGLSYYIQAFEMLSSVTRSVYGVASEFLISTGVNFFFCGHTEPPSGDAMIIMIIQMWFV